MYILIAIASLIIFGALFGNRIFYTAGTRKWVQETCVTFCAENQSSEYRAYDNYTCTCQNGKSFYLEPTNMFKEFGE